MDRVVTTTALDHVILVVEDLDKASDELRRSHGLASTPGGRHPGHGTSNRIVPLGGSYLEVMAVTDPAEAASSPMGRWAMAAATDLLVPAALCLRTDDAGAEAARLGLEPRVMSRTRPDGVVLSWRLVGVDETFGPQRLPFFIQWDDMNLHPSRTWAPHRLGVGGIDRVVLSGDAEAIRRRIGEHPDLPLFLEPGAPGVRSVAISTDDGPIILGV
jgi:hypothetical protein